MEHLIHHGDCLAVLKGMPDNSVDAVVTDPPYGLSFMGKRWDYDVPEQAVWEECLRVLKPGGHLLAFAGTRTQHRMAVRIEDAGFEIRDMIAWVYGSGFPKSLDVSKAIDRQRDDFEDIAEVVRFLERSRIASGVTRRQVEDHFGTVNIGQAFFTLTPGSKPRVPMWDQWLSLKALLSFDDSMDAEVWRLNGRKGQPGEAWHMREVIGQTTTNRDGGAWAEQVQSGMFQTGQRVIRTTAPATDAARQWDGWGTALKPAMEPITVARKPLVGTVAENVLEHGTGALNIDGCRVQGAKGVPASLSSAGRLGWNTGGDMERKQQQNGRWPANLIHDGSDEVVGLFPGNRPSRGGAHFHSDGFAPAEVTNREIGYGDSGSAARFFYCAKASKADRDEGCEVLEERVAGVGDVDESSGRDSTKPGNHHPTVKPTALMRYLCRLVTPPGGTVLDPFTGSGSTGKAAKLEGFSFIGIEREAEYVAIARARIAAVPTEPPTLFS